MKNILVLGSGAQGSTVVQTINSSRDQFAASNTSGHGIVKNKGTGYSSEDFLAYLKTRCSLPDSWTVAP